MKRFLSDWIVVFDLYRLRVQQISIEILRFDLGITYLFFEGSIESQSPKKIKFNFFAYK